MVYRYTIRKAKKIYRLISETFGKEVKCCGFFLFFVFVFQKKIMCYEGFHFYCVFGLPFFPLAALQPNIFLTKRKKTLKINEPITELCGKSDF